MIFCAISVGTLFSPLGVGPVGGGVFSPLRPAAAARVSLAARGWHRFWGWSAAGATPQAKAPGRLSETGLVRPGGPGQLAGGGEAFTPQFQLWGDGASKRRWLSLPAGQSIDKRD